MDDPQFEDWCPKLGVVGVSVERYNAGWQLYLHMGRDEVPKGDLRDAGYTAKPPNTLSPLPLLMGKLTAATLYYKLNPYITFGFEQLDQCYVSVSRRYLYDCGQAEQ